MTLGTRDQFLYWECSECGCLSLAEVPEDLQNYYPRSHSSVEIRPASIARRFWDAWYLSHLPFPLDRSRRGDLDVVRRVRLKKNMSLLDVGCGAGSLIGGLRELGFNARGVDPFIHRDVEDRFGTRVERKTLAEIEGPFDVILFRHSLEHMPVDTLSSARKRLNGKGICVVCIPVLGWAWRNYGTDWSQLDAPRHLFLHSRKSFTMLAEKSGFRVEEVVFDSSESQFWTSESYQRNIPLNEISEPTRSQRNRMRRLASALNEQEQGDTAQFYLRPV